MAMVVGSSGIGFALCLEIAKRGARVFIWDVQKPVDPVPSYLQDQIEYVYCDLSEPHSIRTAFNTVKQKFKTVSILINNAGIVSPGSLLSKPYTQVRKTFEVNTLSHFTTIQCVLPDMLANRKGHIVTIGSTMGLLSVSNMTDYCASKYATVGFHDALRQELHATHFDHSIHTTLVCPGLILTGMFHGIRIRYPFLFPPLKTNDVVRCILTALEQTQTYHTSTTHSDSDFRKGKSKEDEEGKECGKESGRKSLWDWYKRRNQHQVIWLPIAYYAVPIARMLPTWVLDYVCHILVVRSKIAGMDPTPPATPPPDNDQLTMDTENEVVTMPVSGDDQRCDQDASRIIDVVHDGPHFRKQRCQSDLSLVTTKQATSNTSSTSTTSALSMTRRRGSVDGTCCANCKTTSTPMWRRGLNGDNLCNACGLYFRNHGLNRPIHVTSDGTVTHASRTRKISTTKKGATLSSTSVVSSTTTSNVLSRPLMVSRSPVLTTKSVAKMFAKRNSAPCIYTLFHPQQQPQPLPTPHGLNPFAVKIGDGVVVNMTPRQDSRRYALIAGLHVDNGVVTDFFPSWLDLETDEGHPPIHTLPSGERIVSVPSMPSVVTDMNRTVPVSCIVDRFTLHISPPPPAPSMPTSIIPSSTSTTSPTTLSTSALFSSASIRNDGVLLENECEEDEDVLAASILLQVRGGIH